MDKKQSVKISIGTIVCIFIIILLIVILGIVYYFGLVKSNEKISELENAINQLNEQVLVENEESPEKEIVQPQLPVQEPTKTDPKDLVYRLAIKKLYEYDLLYLNDGTKIKPNNVTITDISIMEGKDLAEALNMFSESEKKNIELIGSINYTSTYPEEYNGKGSKAGSNPPNFFIVTKENEEYKIEIATGL